MEDRISSSEAEGAFNEFIDDKLDSLVNDIINDGEVTTWAGRDSDIVIEMDDITPPRFTYGEKGGGAGGGGQGPGEDAGRLRFSLPYRRFMELVARKLRLPNLSKAGCGRIKEVSYEFKTVGPAGVILDKKRTFKRALKTSIAAGSYAPHLGRRNVLVRRGDRRYKLPERVERPRFKAVVFYMGDISYSTYGERLELEKRVVGFIHRWLDFNYGPDNVDHRFFVHDSEAYEVMPDQFYDVSNAGGTRAAIVFQLVAQIACNEYDPETTNFYAYYFGDGELFDKDAEEIGTLLEQDFRPIFNSVGIIEVKPSSMSRLGKVVAEKFDRDTVIRLACLRESGQVVDVVKTLFANSGESSSTETEASSAVAS